MLPTDVEHRVCERLRKCHPTMAEALVGQVAARQAFGLKKYPTRLADNLAPYSERLQHMLEEVLDGAIYAEWAMRVELLDMLERVRLVGMQRSLLEFATRLQATIQELTGEVESPDAGGAE